MRFVVVGVVFAVAVLAAGCATGPYAERPLVTDPMGDTLKLMTNQDVIALSRAGIGDSVIIDMMKLAGSEFRLRTQDVVELADSGVSDNVISAMIQSGRLSRYRDWRGWYYSYPMYMWYDGYFAWYPEFSFGLWYPSAWPVFARAYYVDGYAYRLHSGFHRGGGSNGIRAGGRHR